MEENGDKDWENVIGRDGEEYKVLAYVLADGDDSLRLVIAVNDRYLRSSSTPLTRGEIMRRDGSFAE
jgi:hypothetical protein